MLIPNSKSISLTHNFEYNSVDATIKTEDDVQLPDDDDEDDEDDDDDEDEDDE